MSPAAVAEREQNELLKKLEEFGFDKDAILKSVSQEDFNQITASFFLLQQQYLQEQGPKSGHREGGGGGCPFAHSISVGKKADESDQTRHEGAEAEQPKEKKEKKDKKEADKKEKKKKHM